MKFHRSFRPALPALLAGLFLFVTASAWADPPGRVARISYLGGQVSFAPGGEDGWYSARLNRPLIAGDRLWTGRGGRVELELGSAVARLDQGSSFEFLNLDDRIAQIQLTEGTINLRVDHLYQGQVYEIDTPTLAFVVSEPGEYRLDVGVRDQSTQVTVFDGYAEVYGEGGRRVTVQTGTSQRFFDAGLRDYQRLAMPRPDDFDHWAFARNERHLNSPSRRYVSSDLIGYSDLDDYGSWRNVSNYGHVWFPRRVAAGWAPFRDGHWSWIDPWGWTWVDDAPWGFAPSHYGRWVYVSSGWGWIPGPRHVRPIYAPALVAFVGGSNWSLSVSTGGPPIGWFPLGPRDVYVPWYRVSRGYFSSVNVHNTVVVNNIYVTNIYNDYYVQGRPLRGDYTFHGAVNAVSVMPRDAFASARNAAESMARTRLRPGALEHGELLMRAPAAPTRASLADSSAMTEAPPTRGFERAVIARNEPAAPMAPFEARERAIARNGGEPLAADQMQRLNVGDSASERDNQVRVIGRDMAGAGSDVGLGERGLRGRDPTVIEPESGKPVLGEVDGQPAPIEGGLRGRGRELDPIVTDPAIGETAPSVRSDPFRRGVEPVDAPAPVIEPGPPGGHVDEGLGRERALPSSRYARGGAGMDRGAEVDSGIPLPSRRGDDRGFQPEAAPTPIEPRFERGVEPAERSLERQREMPIRSLPEAAPEPREWQAPPQREERVFDRGPREPMPEQAPPMREFRAEPQERSFERSERSYEPPSQPTPVEAPEPREFALPPPEPQPEREERSFDRGEDSGRDAGREMSREDFER